jgi:small conductance mechanosensitive channel
LAFVVVAAPNQLGIQTATFIAVLGAAGLAIGLALQGSLYNFATGVLMIIFKPFKGDDYVEGAGIAGIVEEIQIFTTQLKSLNNRTIIVPNSRMMGDNITN